MYYQMAPAEAAINVAELLVVIMALDALDQVMEASSRRSTTKE